MSFNIKISLKNKTNNNALRNRRCLFSLNSRMYIRGPLTRTSPRYVFPTSRRFLIVASQTNKILHYFWITIIFNYTYFWNYETITLSRSILVLQMTQRRGNNLWETAICMVFTKHFLHTTWCPQGEVFMVALAYIQITHWNNIIYFYIYHYVFVYRTNCELNYNG